MSDTLKKNLNELYQQYTQTGSKHSFLTWVQIQRTGTIFFNPTIQGCSGLEIDDLLFKHSLGLV